MSHYKNKSRNLRKSDVINSLTSDAKDLPVSAAAVAGVAGRLEGALLIGTPVLPVAATVNLKLAAVPEDEDSITVGDEVYVFVDELSDPEEADDSIIEVEIEETAGACQANLKTAFGDSTIFTAGTFSDNSVKLTAKVKGQSTHAISLETNLADGDDGFDKETFTGGVNGTVAAKGTVMVGTTKIYVAVDDCTEAVSNWKNAALANGV